MWLEGVTPSGVAPGTPRRDLGFEATCLPRCMGLHSHSHSHSHGHKPHKHKALPVSCHGNGATRFNTKPHALVDEWSRRAFLKTLLHVLHAASLRPPIAARNHQQPVQRCDHKFPGRGPCTLCTQRSYLRWPPPPPSAGKSSGFIAGARARRREDVAA